MVADFINTYLQTIANYVSMEIYSNTLPNGVTVTYNYAWMAYLGSRNEGGRGGAGGGGQA